MILGISLFLFLFLFLFIFIYLFKIKKQKFLYKSAFKTSLKISFSVIILFVFFGLSFGYIYGSSTASYTYSKNLVNQNQNLNTQSLEYKLGERYYLGSNNSFYNTQFFLSEEYWNFFINNEEINGSCEPYEEGVSTWEDFNNCLINEKFYDESALLSFGQENENIYLSPISMLDINPQSLYTNLTIFDYIYNNLFNEDYQIYYRIYQYFETNVRKNANSSFNSYKNISFVKIQDYNPLTNTYYDSWEGENGLKNQNNLMQKTYNLDSPSYYVSDYEWMKFAPGYDEDDLLAINNHEDGIYDDVMEVGISYNFYNENNIKLGQKYYVQYQLSNGNYKNIVLEPIAVYQNTSVETGASFYNGEILINSLDYNKLVYDVYTGSTIQGNTKSILFLQTSDYLNYQLSNVVNSNKYNKNLENDRLVQQMNQINEYLFYSMFPNQTLETIKPKELSFYKNNFYSEISLISTSTSHLSKPSKNSISSANLIYLNFIISSIVMIFLILVIIFIISSIVNKKIKENYAQFGVLKSFGYKTKDISIAYLTFPIVLILFSNIFAFIISIPFYFIFLNSLINFSYITISSVSLGYIFLIFTFSSLFVFIFSYLKIYRSLRIKELILLEGKSLYVPNRVFRIFSSIGNNFKNFEKAYVYKNIFKSISKSSLVFFTILFSLFLFLFSFTITSSVKINSYLNLDGFKFQYVSKLKGSSNSISSDLLTKFKSSYVYLDDINNYEYSNEEDLFSQAFVGDTSVDNSQDGIYTLGLDEARIYFDQNVNQLTFNEMYNGVTKIIFDYMSTIPFIFRNNLLPNEVDDYWKLFDYTYIPVSTTEDFIYLYFNLYIMYINENNYNFGHYFDEPGFYNGNINSRGLTFNDVYKKIFKYSINDWIVDQNIVFEDLINLINDNSVQDILIKIKTQFDETFLPISLGKKFYDGNNVDNIGIHYYHFTSEKVSQLDNYESTINVFDSIDDIYKWLDISSKKNNPIDALEAETPNKEYIPVIIDQNVASSLDIDVGDYFYSTDLNKINKVINFKVVSIMKNVDYGIITTNEFINEYTNNRYIQYNHQLSSEEQDQLTYSVFFNYDIYKNLLLGGDDPVFINKDVTNLPNSIYTIETTHYLSNNSISVQRAYDFVDFIYKIFLASMLIISIILIIIPGFMVLISIKEVIDDNLVEVSMLKTFGYSTYKSSRLILSPYIIIALLSFIVLIPIGFILFSILSWVVFSLTGFWFIFKIFAWQWVFLILVDLLIIFALLSISYYSYKRLNNEKIQKNLF